MASVSLPAADPAATVALPPLLDVKGLCVHFGGIRAVNGLSCTIAKGSITGLIGPNGSGKTTFINTVTGMYKPDKGEILFCQRNIAGLRPHVVSRRGIGRTFQITRLFSQMTVLENLLIAQKNQKGEHLLLGVLSPASVRTEEEYAKEKAMAFLDFIGLRRLADELAGGLSYGQQKLLEIARVLMIDPDMILLDEPFAGVNPTNIERLLEMIIELNRDRGITIVLVEHMMKIMMRLAGTIIVMKAGALIAEGTPAEIQRNEAAIEAYLGS